MTAEVVRQEAGVRLTYCIEGDLGVLSVPPPASSNRTEELWRTTCCEWFVADPQGPGYAELNFSPSGEWAAYHFNDQRKGMRDLLLDQPLSLTSAQDDEGLIVTAEMPWQFANAARFGCSAVLEHVDGRRAFHALAHGSGPPDFHARACFTGVLGGRDEA